MLYSRFALYLYTTGCTSSKHSNKFDALLSVCTVFEMFYRDACAYRSTILYMNISLFFLSQQRGWRCVASCARRSPILLAPVGHTETQRMQPMHSAVSFFWGLSMEMASVGHSLAQVPQLVQRSLAVGKGPVQPCL